MICFGDLRLRVCPGDAVEVQNDGFTKLRGFFLVPEIKLFAVHHKGSGFRIVLVQLNNKILCEPAFLTPG